MTHDHPIVVFSNGVCERRGGAARRRGQTLPMFVPLDNRYVVPHNIALCIKYNAHINVEVCASIKAVKYVYKYVYKGHDRVMLHFKRTGNT